MPERGTIDVLYILCLVLKKQEQYQNMDKKLYMCFVDREKAFGRVPRKVMEWSIRQRGLPKMLVKEVMRLYEEATTKVRVKSGPSE